MKASKEQIALMEAGERIATLEGDRNSEILRANNAEIRAEVLEAKNKRLREVVEKVILVPLHHTDKHMWVQRMCDMLSAALAAEKEE